MKKILATVLVAIFVFAAAMPASIRSLNIAGSELQAASSSSLPAFKSASEFDKYIDEINSEYEKQNKGSSYGGTSKAKSSNMPMAAPSVGSPAGLTTNAKEASDDGASDSDNITNVQEQGVDEGDIVKNYKNYLVILRRGRLFSVDTSERSFKAVSKANAYPTGFSKGTWYDEMLIYNGKIVVIGYTYDMRATQVGIFKINDEGKISHVTTHFIDSNDYYSSRNYTSRLIGNQLVFYMPFYLFKWDSSKRVVKFPQVRTWTSGNNTTSGKDILSKTDIYRPKQQSLTPTLHVVAQCDLDDPEFHCKTKAIMGPYSRSFYVSPNAIYVWVSPEYRYWTSDEERHAERSSFVYQIQLDDESARALQAHGAPIDQFSFKESSGYLNVVVRSHGGGDAMWHPEFSSGRLSLMRTSLSNFSDKPTLVSKSDYTMLTTPKGSSFQNRFVGDYLLYGTGGGWYFDPKAEHNIYTVQYAGNKKARAIPVSHSVDRIEVMGNGAVVVGGREKDIFFSSLELSGAAKVKDTYKIKDAMQGETRSHGFFYKPTSTSEGILGLPLRNTGRTAHHLTGESAEVRYLKVSSDKSFSDLGALTSKASGSTNDSCKFSCVDWYGNSRPIFLKDRIMALMGYELVEGIISDGKLKESERLSFYIQ